MVRRWALVGVVAFGGCESLKTAPAPPPEPGAPPARVPLRAAAPPPGIVPVAARVPAPQPPQEPETPQDALSLAADCLSRGDHASAAPHLEAHVRGHPEQVMFRVQLAELYLRLGRDDAARVHFEQFAAEARRLTGPAKKQVVHAHTRLMEIAQRDGDRFGEVLHRGVGLLLLTAEQDELPERDAGFCEEMACKALKALREAREIGPDDPEVRHWLAEAYDRTGNRRAADAERTVARTAVTPTGLGPALTVRE
ncbi:tetratricopeptide repeat protein [Gemmata sp.]|uniref:tetratricopeptide repeat protein n=1 Tax=Gemmata sp. TaxID=1914242 RepID=UPI003F6FF2E6